MIISSLMGAAHAHSNASAKPCFVPAYMRNMKFNSCGAAVSYAHDTGSDRQQLPMFKHVSMCCGNAETCRTAWLRDVPPATAVHTIKDLEVDESQTSQNSCNLQAAVMGGVQNVRGSDPCFIMHVDHLCILSVICVQHSTGL